MAVVQAVHAAILFSCGMSVVFLVIVLYLFYLREKAHKVKTTQEQVHILYLRDI